MLNWRNVRLIFLREVRDQLRDRRTLFMIAVLPLLLYPALGLGMMQLTLVFREKPRTVVVLGAEHLPDDPPLVDGRQFAARWFKTPEAASRLVVITDDEAGGEDDPAEDAGPRAADLLRRAREIREALQTDPQRGGALFGTSEIQLLIIVPEGLREHVAAVREKLSDRHSGAGVSTTYPRPEIFYNKADEKSQMTYLRAASVLERWEEQILGDWLKRAELDTSFTHPVLSDPIDVSLREQVAASIWGKLFPALLVVMSITGAFYPAIDLVAGEKERGTMETLLICPATRTEIVLGKFFTVMLFSCSTALLNLASMGLTSRHVASMVPAGALPGSGTVLFPPFWALACVILLLLPLAALFSALCLALATFARSSKEGQYYLTPLLMVTLGLTIFCLSPGVDLTPQYSILPVAGVALLLKGLLLSSLQPGSLYAYIVPVLATSIAYSALALWWAIDQFQREEVLFREAERFELRLWFRHLLRDKEPVPSFTEAGFCFVLIMLLQFFSWRYMQERIGASDDALRGQVMVQLIIIQQLAIVASPALFMGVMLTTSLWRTFRIRWPDWKTLGAACVLPFALHPLSVEALAHLRWFFGDIPADIVKQLATMSNGDVPFWFVLLAFAAAPAFCEEVVFRGFILSGFGRHGRVVLAIGLSSIAFGLMHMIPEQVFNATLMGLVLGALAVRSRSLLPCIVFHFANNTLGVLHARFGAEWLRQIPENPFVAVRGGSARYDGPLLVLCVLVATPILWWLARPLFARKPAHRDQQAASGIMTSVPA